MDCPAGATFDPRLLLEYRPVLQACFLISTYDAFGNEILASTEDLDLTYAASAQVAVDFRQLQNTEGEVCPV